MTDCFDVHGLTVETSVDLQIPPTFRAPMTMPAVVTVEPMPASAAVPFVTPKRSGVFRYGTTDTALKIEYKTPFGQPRLLLEDLRGHPGIAYTPAFKRHGDLTPLARAVYRLRLLWCGWPLVHAGALERDGTGTLITAPPDHGKTSTVLSLLGEDTRLLADDHVLLSADGRLRSYPRPVNLSPFTLTGPIDRSDGPVARLKRRMAASRFEMVFGMLGIEMGERVTVPPEYVADGAGEVGTVVVLAGGQDGVTAIDADAAARHILTATMDEFDPFGHYAVLLYAHAFDVDLASVVGDLQTVVRSAIDGADCYRVGASDVAEYPRLIEAI